MLPFFFRHYDPLVSQYFIFDDHSSDGSLDLMRAHPNVEVEPFVRSDPDSFTLSELSISNECWKRSRGSADWVLVIDIDEHLFHPDLSKLLMRYQSSQDHHCPSARLPDGLDHRGSDALLLREFHFRAPWDIYSN
jgi:hypothetical protein